MATDSKTKRPRPVGRPRSDGKPQLTKQALLQAVAKLMAEHGYSGTSIRMIADELDSTTASVFNLYPSKLDLFVGMMETISTSALNFHDAIAELDLPAPVALFKTIVEDAYKVSTAPYNVVALFYVPEIRLPDFHDAKAFRDRMIVAYKRLLDQGVSEGDFICPDTSWTAEQVLQLTETSILSNKEVEKEVARERAQETARFCLRGLQVKEADIALVEQRVSTIDLSF